MACPLCDGPAGEVLWQDALLRVVLPAEPDLPGFARVILNAHVAEMTDLPAADRDRVMAAVWKVEAVQRAVLRPDKVNLASLGNAVPHLHWHVVPRWRDDARFPGSPWTPPAADPVAGATRVIDLDAYRASLRAAFGS